MRKRDTKRSKMKEDVHFFCFILIVKSKQFV